MNKFFKSIKRYSKKIGVAAASAALAVCSVFGASAAEGSDYADVAVSAMQQGLQEVTNTISIGNVVTVLVAVIGICIGLVFFWWAIRKVIRMVMSAFKKGKISV